MGFLMGILIGGFIGTSFGVAGMGGAINGMIPFAIVGGVIGLLIQKALKNKTRNSENRNNVASVSNTEFNAVTNEAYDEDSWFVKLFSFIFRIIFIVGLGFIIATVFRLM